MSASNIRKYKTKQLNQILEANKESPAQGSPEWLARRKKSIGGSEMATFMTDVPGNKPYQNIRSLCEDKLGLKGFKGNKYTRWGNLCEELTRLYTEKLFHTQVHETGALPGCIPNHHYSPDGLGIVDKVYIKKYVDRELYDELPESCFVLFEYKNPFSRIPNGEIPGHYMVQLQTGLNDIVPTDIGIFVDMVVRRCSLSDLDWSNRYDSKYYNDPINFDRPEYIGFIGIAGPIYEDEDDEDVVIENVNEHTVICPDESTFKLGPDECEDCISFGDTSEGNFDIMATRIVSKKYVAFYPTLEDGDFKFYTWYLRFLEFCEEKKLKPIGIMPYKIFRTTVVALPKNTKFIKQHHKKSISDFIEFISEHMDKDDKAKREALEEKYPKSGKLNPMAAALVQDLGLLFNDLKI
jgi:hypothetical protein